MNKTVIAQIEKIELYKTEKKFIHEVFAELAKPLDPNQVVLESQLTKLKSYESKLSWLLVIAKGQQDLAFSQAWQSKPATHGASERNKREVDAEVMPYTAIRNMLELCLDNLKETINLGKKLMGNS